MVIVWHVVKRHTPGFLLEFLKKKKIFFSSAWLSAELMNQNSSVVRRPTVRLWHRLSLNLHGFLSNFGSWAPWAVRPDVKKLGGIPYEYFFLLTWDPVGENTSKRYSSHKSCLNLSKFFLNILSSSHKSTVLDFWILSLRFLTIHHCTLWINWRVRDRHVVTIDIYQ